jgi:hypothetical protein
LEGLESIENIGGRLGISNNFSLADLTGLENVISVGGSVSITGNEALINLAGLENIVTIEGIMFIDNNNSMSSLDGLNSLEHIEGGLHIGSSDSGNPVLINLSGLESLHLVGGSIYIRNNESLNSLSGFENVNPDSINYIVIYGNDNLSDCAVQSICDYLAGPNTSVDIHDNAPDCDNQQEVEEACDSIVSVENEIVKHEVTISPNPVIEYATLRLNSAFSGPINIYIYNTTGICLRSWQYHTNQSGQNDFPISLKEIPAGMYFLQVKAGNEMITKKIIKSN